MQKGLPYYVSFRSHTPRLDVTIFQYSFYFNIISVAKRIITAHRSPLLSFPRIRETLHGIFSSFNKPCALCLSLSLSLSFPQERTDQLAASIDHLRISVEKIRIDSRKRRNNGTANPPRITINA